MVMSPPPRPALGVESTATGAGMVATTEPEPSRKLIEPSAPRTGRRVPQSRSKLKTFDAGLAESTR